MKIKISFQEFKLLKKSGPAQTQVCFILKSKQPASMFPEVSPIMLLVSAGRETTFPCYVSGKVNSIVKKLVMSQVPN